MKALLAIVRSCVDLCDNSERVHERVFQMANANDVTLRFPYGRFDVNRDMDKVKLDEWRKMPEMTSLTKKYMSEGTSVREMNRCVQWILNPPEFLRT